jgi:protocatechuate 3,4-dioxygenase alpha subunit
MTLPTTPSQTVGPFFGFGLSWADGPYVVPAGVPGGFWIRGQVFDGAGEPVPDALIETWQADPQGRFATGDEPLDAAFAFRGLGRSCTDPRGFFGVFTVKPGRVSSALARAGEAPSAARARLQAPHVAVTVLARGLLNRVVTRIYFADEPAANAEDPVLASLPDPSRGATLLATPLATPLATALAAAGGDGYRFDIHLQGEHETVFFDF